MKAFWHYFTSVNAFNLVASVLAAVPAGLLYFPVIFTSFGTLAGLFCFSYFYNDQYYFYYNLGFTKKKLITTLFIVNAFIAFMLFIAFYLITLWRS